MDFFQLFFFFQVEKKRIALHIKIRILKNKKTAPFPPINGASRHFTKNRAEEYKQKQKRNQYHRDAINKKHTHAIDSNRELSKKNTNSLVTTSRRGK